MPRKMLEHHRDPCRSIQRMKIPNWISIWEKRDPEYKKRVISTSLSP